MGLISRVSSRTYRRDYCLHTHTPRNSFFFYHSFFNMPSIILLLVTIFTIAAVGLLFLFLVNTKTILKCLGIVLLPLYFLKFLYEFTTGKKLAASTTFKPSSREKTGHNKPRKCNRHLFNELMYQKRLEIENDQNKTRIFAKPGVIDLETWKSNS